MTDALDVAQKAVARRPHNYRKAIPAAHKTSVDTRLLWLWKQKFGSVQVIHNTTTDPLDKMATNIIIQAIMARDLSAITLLFTRIEGAPQVDTDLLESAGDPMPL